MLRFYKHGATKTWVLRRIDLDVKEAVSIHHGTFRCRQIDAASRHGDA
jgi:hypothetical protein